MTSKEENKDLEMYIKYAVLKFLQCVTYSRHNCSKMQTDSKILLGVVSADWFNLCIPDNSATLEEVKSLFGGKAIELSQPICIEIYLKTPDLETMTIEYWWIYKTSRTVPKDVCGKVTFYNSLTTLLKSLLLTTRATPGYAIARNQLQTSIKLHHRLSFGEPRLPLADNFKKHLIGVAPSPIGTVEVQIAWRSKLLLDAKSVSQLSGTTENSQINLITHLASTKNLVPRGNVKAVPTAEEEALATAGKKAAFGSPLGANFVDSVRDEVPFSSLLKYANSTRDNPCNPSNEDNDVIAEQITQEHPDNKNISQHLVTLQDDFVMIEQNYPFASQEELIKFYQEFQDAPPLSMFEDDFPLEEPLDSILEQIAHFEMNAEQINEFVNSLEQLSDA